MLHMARLKSIFKTRIRSKRRADLITIKSPTAFRNSIRELRKGIYTLGDFRALVLARTRATAMLKKRNLSRQERKQILSISKINIPAPVSRKKTK